MPKIYSHFDLPPSRLVNLGSNIEKQYRLTRDDHYNSVYTEVSETNIDDYINSFKNGCSLQTLLERCSLLPTREKISYLNNNDASISGDFRDFNTDLTAMFIKCRQLALNDPALIQRINAGESFNSIIKSIIDKEVTTDGQSNESSND